MSFFDDVWDWVLGVTDWFSNIADWFSDRFSGVGGLFDGILGDANGGAIGLTLVFGAFLAISLLDDPFNTGMDVLPLFYRILAVVLFLPICYFICTAILDK